MSFLSPIWLAMGALAAPIIILYMLKLRRREVEVSSTMLWQLMLRDRQANTPWQRLKRNLLLFLQLLILALLVLGLARPSIQVAAVASGSVVVLLDASASMQATDVSPSRFEAAKSEVLSLISGLSGDSQMTIILAGEQPSTLISREGDKGELRQALGTAQPTQGTTDWSAAFALAAGAVGSAEKTSTIVIISDGGMQTEGLPPLPGEVRFVSIGLSVENVAITALALRPAAEGPELFASVTNHGDAEQTVLLSFYRDGEFLDSRSLNLKGGSNASVTLSSLPNQKAVYEARLSDAVNADTRLDTLSLDDAAFAIYQPANEGRTLLISPGNIFLEQLLTAIPGITPFRALPNDENELSIPNEPFDLYVFDGIIPGELPEGDLLLVNPPTNELFMVGEVFTDFSEVEVVEHPLTLFVAWDNIHIKEAHRVILPVWAEALVDTPNGPLVFAGETGGRRVAVVTFDLHDSDLPLQIAFPILFSNLLTFLTQPQAFETEAPLRPGDNLHISPEIGVTSVTITSPSGLVYSPAIGDSGVIFDNTEELGLYTVTYSSESGETEDSFAVNLFSPIESDIRPAESLHIGRREVAASPENQVGQRELWPWLAGLAVVTLLVEWWVYHQRRVVSIDLIEKMRNLRKVTRNR